MPQVTIYLDGQTAALLDSAAKAAGVSRSQWIGGAVRLRARTEWPASIQALAGAWSDFPDLAQIRKRLSADVKREKF